MILIQRPLGPQVDQSARIALAEQHRLWPLDHLDALQVVDFGIGYAAKALHPEPVPKDYGGLEAAEQEGVFPASLSP